MTDVRSNNEWWSRSNEKFSSRKFEGQPSVKQSGASLKITHGRCALSIDSIGSRIKGTSIRLIERENA